MKSIFDIIIVPEYGQFRASLRCTDSTGKAWCLWRVDDDLNQLMTNLVNLYETDESVWHLYGVERK